MTNFYNTKDGYESFSLTVCAYLVAQMILGSILLATEEGSFLYCAIYAVMTLSLLAIAYWYSKRSKKSFLVATTANVKPNLAQALWGCLATFGLIHMMLPVNEWFFDFIEWCGLSRPNLTIDLPLWAFIVIPGILAPIAEEFIFRGTIGMGQASKGGWRGIFANGALFALFHMNPAQTLHQFVLGSLLMLLTARSASVWTSVIVHAFNNLAVVFLSYVVEPTGFYENNDLLLLLGGGAIFVGALAGYFLTTKKAPQRQVEQQAVSSTTKSVFWVTVGACLFLWVLNLFLV